MRIAQIITIIIILLIIICIVSYISEVNFIQSNSFRKKNNDRNSNTKIIYSYGLFSDDPMPENMKLNINSNAEVTGMNYEVLGYDDVLRDMEKVPLKELQETYEMIPRGVSKADLARLVHLYVRGGHYADLDVEFRRKPVVAHQNQLVILYTENYALRARVANYALTSPPKHPFVLAVIKEIVIRVKRKIKEKKEWNDDDVLQTTGPDVITDVYRTWNKGGVKRIGLINSYLILSHKAEGSWRRGKDFKE